VEVTVRDARPGDGEGIARCHLDSAAAYVEQGPALFRMPDEDGFVEWIEEALRAGHADHELELVAEVGGEIAGHLEGHLIEPMDTARWQMVRYVGERRLYVDALAIARAYRRHGAGRALMEAAESWASDRGAVLVALDTWIDSPLSVPFYEALGYDRRSIIFQKRL
jgi:GNAT superfamily N-acetyltransferase